MVVSTTTKVAVAAVATAVATAVSSQTRKFNKWSSCDNLQHDLQ
jgi:hypothetical protein